MNGALTTWTHDGTGNPLLFVYPGGRMISATYDGLHRKTQVADGQGAIASWDSIGPRRVERRTL